jgi:hypothetical protein
MINVEKATHETEFVIQRFNSKDFDEFGFFAPPVGAGRTTWKGNALLNSGIQLLLDLAIGAIVDSASYFNNTNVYIGIGTSTVAAASTQNGLQCTAASKWWNAMEAGYPSRTSETIWFKAIIGSDDANYSWAEFTVLNGASDAVATNLNRSVSNQGVKASGQTWTIDVKITLD